MRSVSRPRSRLELKRRRRHKDPRQRLGRRTRQNCWSSWSSINSARTTSNFTGAQWTKGLRRLMDRGAVFTEAAYPYAATLTCAGHATIATGAFPAVHGMSGNDFYDRTLRRTGAVRVRSRCRHRCRSGGRSAASTTAGARCSCRRSARNCAARRSHADAHRRGGAKAAIVDYVRGPRRARHDRGLRRRRRHVGDFGCVHDDAVAGGRRVRPCASDDGRTTAPSGSRSSRSPPIASLTPVPGEARTAPWTQTFPHPLISSKGVPDNEFVTAWEQSPWDDEFLTDLAIHLLKAKRLGTGDGHGRADIEPPLARSQWPRLRSAESRSAGRAGAR